MSKSRTNTLVNQLLEADTWQPRASDIQWTENLIRSIKDGGMWAIPMSSNIYRVNHTKKALELIEGDALEMHDMVTKCCARMVPPYACTIAPERRQNLKTN